MGKGSETKELILSAALDFTSKLGLESLSIGELAKKVGMSKSGLFGHFNSKEKLQMMVIDHAAKNFTDNIFKKAFKEPRGIDRIKGIVHHWYNWSDHFFTGGCPLVAAAFEYDDRPGPVRDHIQKYQKMMISSFKQSAEQAVKEGQFREDLDCDSFAFEFYGLMLGLHLYHRLLQNEQAYEIHKKSFEALIERSKS